MTTIVRISTDWQTRIHVQADADASVLDCLLVELPPYTFGVPALVYREGACMEELRKEAIEVVALLRAQPREKILPERVFIPFAVITERNFADVAREHELRMLALVGGRTDENPAHPDHMERVRALGRMAELLYGTVAPQQLGSFPPIRH